MVIWIDDKKSHCHWYDVICVVMNHFAFVNAMTSRAKWKHISNVSTCEHNLWPLTSRCQSWSTCPCTCVCLCSTYTAGICVNVIDVATAVFVLVFSFLSYHIKKYHSICVCSQSLVSWIWFNLFVIFSLLWPIHTLHFFHFLERISSQSWSWLCIYVYTWLACVNKPFE